MSIDVTDLRSTIIPRSDQLNAEQLLGGPIVITVNEVTAGAGEDQPVSVHYENEGGRPFKPCKTMRKVLIHAWGPNGNQWVGRSMELYCDHAVKFGGEAVGGIRISRLSHISKDIRVALTATRGKKAQYEIKRLQVSEALHAALNAIGAASNNETLKKAKALAQKLTDADAEFALNAYRKRVEELKAQAAAAAAAGAEGAQGGDAALLDAYKESIDKAADSEAASLALDEARDVLPAEAHAQLTEHWRTRWAQSA